MGPRCLRRRSASLNAIRGTSAGRAVLWAMVLWPAVAAAAPQPVVRPAAPVPAHLLLELPSRRVISEARPDVLSSAIAPGSLVKAVTLVTALEAGVVSETTRVVCTRSIDLDGRRLTCVHPDLHRGLSPEEALAHSCNVFFGIVARRVPRGAFDDTLVRLGVGASSPRAPMTHAAVGIDGVRATPRQWLEAFVRLTGVSAPALQMKAATRAVLLGGLRQAVTDGTAVALREAGLAGVAKTGTAPMPGGGYLGLVATIVDSSPPSRALIVVAPGASGAQAAELAAGILTNGPARERVYPHDTAPAAERSAPARGSLRVGHVTRDGRTEIGTVTLEDVVARGVAGEGGDDLAPAALEALAITIRTFAVRAAGRHAGDGYDICDLTHCVVQKAATERSSAAVSRTKGQVLLVKGTPAEVYFSADCGGHTERPADVWPGATNPAHLPAQRDGLCARRTGWQSEIAEPQLRGVLLSGGFRGASIEALRVASRSPSGRVRQLSIAGLEPGQVPAEQFRLMVGRSLGWQVLKSSMFDVERSGPGFRFSGRGMGHGVGLCVRGTDARAKTGASAAIVLAFYFPGATIGAVPLVRTRIGVRLPESERGRTAEIRGLIDRELQALALRLAADAPPALDVVFHPTIEAFGRATGLAWWMGGRTRGSRIDLLPVDLLIRRDTLALTLRHELVHVLTESSLAGRPLWVREGLARVMAGEWREREPAGPPSTSLPCPTDVAMTEASSPDTARAAYEQAARCVGRALARGVPWRDLR